MKTPILDFVKAYRKKNAVRLHMPGHKGKMHLGAEPMDITEIAGADELYHASGIIRESEQNATALFGTAQTLYSTEGSSLCIRAMLLLIQRLAASRGEKPRILAARNAHKSFLSALALLDIEVEWLFSKGDSLLSCELNLEELEQKLSEQKFTALYVTSPDYLGNRADIAHLSALCRKHSTLLAVDNAHGAYLKFLQPSLHPIDLGADICCDSAHKTLPTLTGGAYLHIAKNADPLLAKEAKSALALFASTSPSYLTLASLDLTNRLLATTLPKKLSVVAARADKLGQALKDKGFLLIGDEPIKLTLATKSYGYRGDELARILEKHGIVCEFCDPDFVVLMLSSDTTAKDVKRLKKTLTALPKRPPICEAPPAAPRSVAALSPREAMLTASEQTPLDKAVGKILASPSVGCPPAIPILISGEIISAEAVKCFAYYGMESCLTVKEQKESSL
ncbi:MAG: aminotransferase class V-fold PLP-dependent enzyme [Clostridia bacterium]|nr:aminotransferase class V-fold PLP-dependent enzyme [Clostridia bacterium]